jgi:hypothetical protein
MMNGRERWLAVGRRQKPDRVPMDFWGTDEIRAKVRRHLGAASDDEMYAKLHVDRPVVVDPPYAGPPLADDADLWRPLPRRELRNRELPRGEPQSARRLRDGRADRGGIPLAER